MKKITTILTAVVMLFATSAFATEGENVTAAVKAGFKEDFTNAANVVWEKSSDFYFAEFLLNGNRTSAAYNEDGELVGTLKSIRLTDLPSDLATALAKRYDQYTICGTISELNYDGKTNYYLTVENEKQTVKLKCDSDGYISVEKRSRK